MISRSQSSSKTIYGYNLTTLIETDGRLGHTAFDIIAKTTKKDNITVRTLPTSLDVRGIPFIRNGHSLGSDARRGIEFPSYDVVPTNDATFTAITYAGRGHRTRLQDCFVLVSETELLATAFLRKQDVEQRHSLTPQVPCHTRCVCIIQMPQDRSHGEVAQTDVRIGIAPNAPMSPLVVRDFAEKMPNSFAYRGIGLKLVNYDVLKPDSLAVFVQSGASMIMCKFKSLTRLVDMHRACFTEPMDVSKPDGQYVLKLGAIKNETRKWAYMDKRFTLVVRGTEIKPSERLWDVKIAAFRGQNLWSMYPKLRGHMLKPNRRATQ